jgi:ubiquitin carboxyl-terminal hydrolase 7
LGATINYDPFKLRLYPNQFTAQVLKRQPNLTLREMLGGTQYANLSDITLHYDMMDLSILEFETKKYISIGFVDANLKEYTQELLVPKTANLESVLVILEQKLGLEKSGSYRFYEVVQNKIHQILDTSTTISTISEYSQICIQAVPPQEPETLIQVFFFAKEHYLTFGMPFLFGIEKDEMFINSKERLMEKLHLKKPTAFLFFTKNYSNFQNLEDGDILSDLGEGVIGLQFQDKTMHRKGPEKAIKIVL